MPRPLLLAAALALAAAPASADIVRLGPGSFTPQASVITFDEVPLGTVNPVYNLATADLGNVTVSFGPRFAGQSFTGGFPESLSGIPANPLSLAAGLSDTFTTGDGANPTSPVLSGSPTFNGPVSVLFSKDVAAVGLDGGYFNELNSTSIQAYRRDGSVIGTVTNNGLGIEFFGLTDSTGANSIAGISFFITGPEPAGFAIDNLTFGSAGVIVNPPSPVPAPPAVLLGVVGVAGLAVRRLRRPAVVKEQVA